jgi:hypothetical protein
MNHSYTPPDIFSHFITIVRGIWDSAFSGFPRNPYTDSSTPWITTTDPCLFKRNYIPLEDKFFFGEESLFESYPSLGNNSEIKFSFCFHTTKRGQNYKFSNELSFDPVKYEKEMLVWNLIVEISNDSGVGTR